MNDALRAPAGKNNPVSLIKSLAMAGFTYAVTVGASVPQAIQVLKQLGGILSNLENAWVTFLGCDYVVARVHGVRVVTSIDPNDKFGSLEEPGQHAICHLRSRFATRSRTRISRAPPHPRRRL